MTELSFLSHIDTSTQNKISPNIARDIGALVGWHESFLNSSSYSFDMGNVIDWIDFFSSSWAAALKFDKMPIFCEIIRTSVFSDKGMISILEKILENAESTDDEDVIAVARRKILGERGANIPDATKSLIVNYIIDFMRKNRSMMSKYFLPQQSNSSKK
jgi:hypothetical protein